MRQKFSIFDARPFRENTFQHQNLTTMSHRGMNLDDNLPNDWGFKGKNYLLAIGIDKYTGWKPLNNAVKDAKDFIDVLKMTYQFEEEYVTTLFNSEATEDNIHDTLINLVRTVKEEDNLLIYYSGHGHFVEELQQGYWVPVDAPKGDSVRKYISNSDLVNYLKNIKSHHTFLIVDSCFSGTLMTQLRSGVRSERYPSRRIFASGRNEVVEDGVAGQNSPFAAGIINYLKRNNDRSLKTTTLIEDVKSYLERQDVKQTPVDGRIKSLGDDGGEFIFYLKKSEEDIWSDLQSTGSITDYKKYMNFFPSGKYFEDAQERIHELEEDDFWTNIKRRNTANAYNDYIQEYPGGKFSSEAFKFLEIIEEDTGWADALRMNSLSGFQKFLIKFPSGKYVSEAQQRVAKLRGRIAETDAEVANRQKELDQLIRHEQELAAAKKRFRSVFDDAEKLFAEKKYAAAQARYLDCLKEYREGFEPDDKFLNKRHAESEKYEELSNLYKSGKSAHEQGNYDLAVHYYQKANALHRSPKLEALIKEASSKNKKGSTRSLPKKKKSNTLKYVIFGVIGLVFILGLIGVIDEAVNGGDFVLNESEIEQPAPEESVNERVTPAKKKKTVTKKTVNYARDIKGLWTCSDVKAEIPDIPPLFLNARYNFLDGIVYENAIPLNYFITGDEININEGVIVGTIRMSNNTMTIKGMYNVAFVGSFPVTWTFQRI